MRAEANVVDLRQRRGERLAVDLARVLVSTGYVIVEVAEIDSVAGRRSTRCPLERLEGSHRPGQHARAALRAELDRVAPGIDLTGEFIEAGRSWSELDDDGNVVHRNAGA